MKNRSYFSPAILLLAFIVFFSSCRDKEEPAISPIVGTWNFSTFEDLNIQINGQPLEQFLVDEGLSPQEAQQTANLIKNQLFSAADFAGTVLIFKADGTYEVTVNGTVDESGTYELRNGNTLLRLTSDSETQEFQVKELTTNRLTILLEEEESDDFFEEGSPVLVKLQLELSFVK
ncbi:MAG: lipocalin family protein [Cecembia sp.]